MSNKFPVNRRTVLRNGLWLAGGAAVAGPFGAAARLRLPSTTLESKIKALGIDKRRFKPA
jgi:hypothetical protein